MQAERDLADYAIILSEKDNVATALRDIPKGVYALPSSGMRETITASQDIPAGFKVALSPIKAGDRVYKYGYAIGVATKLIRPGDSVHVHNMASCYRPGDSKHT